VARTPNRSRERLADQDVRISSRTAKVTYGCIQRMDLDPENPLDSTSMTSDMDQEDVYPELRTQFSLRGTGLVPSNITETLGVQPSRVWRAGHRTSPRRNPPTVDGWVLQVGPHVALDFRDQIDELLEQLRPIAAKVRALRDMHDLTIQVNCVAYIADVVPALYFTPEQLRVIQELDATIDVDFMLVEGKPGRSGQS
jgi:hypothetical protein